MEISWKMKPITKRKKTTNTGQEITQIIDLIDKDIKQLLPLLSHMFKKLGERFSMITTDVEGIKEIQVELLEIKKYIRCN